MLDGSFQLRKHLGFIFWLVGHGVPDEGRYWVSYEAPYKVGNRTHTKPHKVQSTFMGPFAKSSSIRERLIHKS